MNKQRLWSGFTAFSAILVLILDSKTALSGAQDGIMLCIRTVIPSLFPFILLSNLLTDSLIGLEFSFLKPVGRLFGYGKGTETLLIPAFLGGYPAGVHSISNTYRAGHISKRDAEQLLAYSSNAGPAFLFGMIGPMFPGIRYSWLLWGIHVLSALLVSRLYSFDRPSAALAAGSSGGIAGSMSSAVKAMAIVCGWVTIFRVLIAFLNRWFLWLLPETVQVAIIGVLELSNGCISLLSVETLPIRFCLCSLMLAAGGLCVTMQTISAAGELSLRYYISGKALQMLFSLILCLCLWHHWIIIPFLFTYFLLITGKFRNNSRNPAAIGV